MTTTDPYSTDDTSTNSTTSDEPIEFSPPSDESSGTPPEPPEFEFEIIATTDSFIEKVTERWWNFFDCILDGVGNNAETRVQSVQSQQDMIPLPPHFTGLRIALGGDKHTH